MREISLDIPIRFYPDDDVSDGQMEQIYIEFLKLKEKYEKIIEKEVSQIIRSIIGHTQQF